MAFTVFLLICCSSINAQFEAGIIGGASVYGGDVGPDKARDYIRQMRFSYGAFVRYRINPYFAVRGHYQNLEIFGEDDISKSAIRQTRNFNFYTDVNELALQLELHPFRDHLPISPYLVGGLAVYHFNPEAKLNGNFMELQPLGTEGQGLDGFDEKYSLTRIAVPVGGGLRFNFGQGMYFGLQASVRVTFFDHLDDIGGLYVDEATLSANGPLAVELAFREDEILGAENLNAPANTPRGGDANDYYYSFTAQFSYQFSSKDNRGFKTKRRKLSCPKF